MADNLVGHTLYQHHIIEINDILLIEEDLANETLEDILCKQAMNGEKFPLDVIKQIIVDITEQLYMLHVIKSTLRIVSIISIDCAHNDIKPENILITPNKYILHDLGQA